MNRQAQAVLMMLLGSVILKISATGMYLRYVKEGLRPLLIVAGALLVAAGIMTLWHELRGGSPAQDGDGHAHHEPRIGWLLMLPVLGLLLVAPPPLGSYAAGKTGSVLTAQNSVTDYPPLPPGDPVRVSLFDYASRAVYGSGKTLTGRNLQLTGFITPGPDGKPMLARIVLTCCAADGRPIKVGLTGSVPSGVPADTWVQIAGTYDSQVEKDPVNKATVPFLEVKTWQQITAPKQPYE